MIMNVILISVFLIPILIAGAVDYTDCASVEG